MTQKDNILQELNELESRLAGSPVVNVYGVPVGYFENLANNVLNRVKALEANDSDELNFLSPFLSNTPRINPYSVPGGYFENLEKGLLFAIRDSKNQTAREELEELSPLLSGLKKQAPYSIPNNYFDNLTNKTVDQEPAPKAKVIAISSRKWFRYAAAAVIIFFVATGAFLFLNKKETIDPQANSYAWVKKNMKKVSTEELDEFITITEKETPVVAINSEPDDIKDLMKNVSDKDIQEFLNDTEILEPEVDEDLFLN